MNLRSNTGMIKTETARVFPTNICVALRCFHTSHTRNWHTNKLFLERYVYIVLASMVFIPQMKRNHSWPSFDQCYQTLWDIRTWKLDDRFNVVSGWSQFGKRLTETEILAFLGIHLLCGAYKAHYRDIKEIFSERDGIPAVYCTMSLQRFECIRRLIRFDDRLRRNPDDPFGPVRDIWTSIINEFRRVYKPSSTVTIDEQLVEFHGRVKFRMYIPSKPGK